MSLTNAPVTIIGIDAATQDAKIGLARAIWDRRCTRVDGVALCSRQHRPVNVIMGWLAEAPHPALLCIDAPLGWPVALLLALADHRAGAELLAAPDGKFPRRATDRFIQKTFRKTPLDVGADRIARTAHAALTLLGRLRRCTGDPIPMAWSPAGLPAVSAIEVYPAATLLSHGCRLTGYRKPDGIRYRTRIIKDMQEVLDLPGDVSLMKKNTDALDAVVCVLAGKDFLDNVALAPHDMALARREGWIWVKRLSNLAGGMPATAITP